MSESIKKLLNSGSKKQRIEAIDKLCQTLSSKNILLLISAFKNSLWFIRKYASDKIVKSFGDKVISYIVKGMNDRDKDISYWSIQTLSQLGVKATDAISSKIKTDLKFPNRQFLVRALGDIGDPKSVPILIHLFNDFDYEIRQEAYNAIVKFEAVAVSDLKKEISKNIDNTFQWSIMAIGKILKDKAVKTLFEYYKKVKSSKLKGHILHALGETESNSAMMFLIKKLNSKSWIIRNIASETIAEKFGKKAVKELNRVFKQGTPDMKYWVLKLIAKILKEQAIPLLINLLKNPKEDIRFYAVTALADVETDEAIYPLIESFNDSSFIIQKTACEGIIRLGAIAKQEMEDALESSDDNVRYWAIKAYARVAGGEYKKFEIIVKNGTKREKLKMIEALREAHNPESLSILLQCLDDSEWIVRNNAHECISNFGSWCYTPLLKAFFTKSDEKKFWIAKIIKNIGTSLTEIVNNYMMETSFDSFKDFIMCKYIDLDIVSKKEILTALLSYLNSNPDEDRKKIIKLFAELEGTEFILQIAKNSKLTNLIKLVKPGVEIDNISVDLGSDENNDALKELVELIEIENEKIDSGDAPTFSFMKYMDKEQGTKTIIEKIKSKDLTPQSALELLGTISKNEINDYDVKYILKLIAKSYFIGLADLRDMLKKYSLTSMFNSAKAMIGDADKYKKNEIFQQFEKEVKYRHFQEMKEGKK